MATLTVRDLAGNVETSSVMIIVQNKMSGTVPEFSGIFLLPLMGMATLVGLAVKRKRNKHSITESR
jgi:hypothetical protein